MITNRNDNLLEKVKIMQDIFKIQTRHYIKPFNFSIRWLNN